MSDDGRDVWVVFRGKLVADPNVVNSTDFNTNELDEVVEVVKAERVSKSYLKLKENPLFHPNIAYGDIIKAKPCEKSLSEKVTILEFSGIEHTEQDVVGDSDVNNFGTDQVGLSPNLVNLMRNFDSKIRPMVEDKFEQGLVFEPVKIVSHGSYKINVAYEASGDDLNKMRDYFKNSNVYFQSSSATNLGSVSFGLETKFQKAVECLEAAHWIKQCYIAFSPSDFPQIEFSSDLIPKNEEDE